MIARSRRALAVFFAAVMAVLGGAAPAYAQTTGGTAPNFTPLVDALVGGLGAGMGILMLFAPAVIFFSVTWMLVKRSSQVAKSGG